MKEALESSGIAFFSADDEGGRGVRLREVSSRASQSSAAVNKTANCVLRGESANGP